MYEHIHIAEGRLDTLGRIVVTQGGTIPAPNTERPFQVFPRNPAIGGVFQAGQLSSNFFGGFDDLVWEWGSNIDGALLTIPSLRASFETDFFDGVNHSCETHFGQGHIPAGWYGAPVAYDYRPFSANMFPSGIQNVGMNCHSVVVAGVVTQAASFFIEDGGASVVYVEGGHNRFVVRGEGLYAAKLVNYSAGGGLLASWAFTDHLEVEKASIGYWEANGDVTQWTSIDGTAMWIGAMAGNGGGRKAVFAIDGAHKGIQLFSGGVSAATDLGGGDGVLGFTNAVVTPIAGAVPANGTREFASGGYQHIETQLGTDVVIAPGLVANTLAFAWPADADQTLTDAQSENSVFELTGGLVSAVRTLSFTAIPNGKVFYVDNHLTFAAAPVSLRIGNAGGPLLGALSGAWFRVDSGGNFKRMSADVLT